MFSFNFIIMSLFIVLFLVGAFLLASKEIDKVVHGLISHDHSGGKYHDYE